MIRYISKSSLLFLLCSVPLCVSPISQAHADSNAASVCIGKDSIIRFRKSSPCPPGERLLTAKYIRGASGQVGPMGPQGPAGETGSAGAQGPTGAQGLAGSQGPAGVQGPTGVPGAVGVAGEVGPSGPTGAAGAVGPSGAVGPIGPAGPASQTAVFAGIKGAVGPSTVSYMAFFTRNFGVDENNITDSSAVLPVSCSFKNLYVHSLNMNLSDSIDVTMIVNGTSTAVTCHLIGQGNGLTSTCSDATNLAPAVPGDLFTVMFSAPANTSTPLLRVSVECS